MIANTTDHVRTCIKRYVPEFSPKNHDALAIWFQGGADRLDLMATRFKCSKERAQGIRRKAMRQIITFMRRDGILPPVPADCSTCAFRRPNRNAMCAATHAILRAGSPIPEWCPILGKQTDDEPETDEA